MESKDLVVGCILPVGGNRTQDELEHLVGHIQQDCMPVEANSLHLVVVETD